jgi:hypothetical protein
MTALSIGLGISDKVTLFSKEFSPGLGKEPKWLSGWKKESGTANCPLCPLRKAEIAEKV